MKRYDKSYIKGEIKENKKKNTAYIKGNIAIVHQGEIKESRIKTYNWNNGNTHDILYRRCSDDLEPLTLELNLPSRLIDLDYAPVASVNRA